MSMNIHRKKLKLISIKNLAKFKEEIGTYLKKSLFEHIRELLIYRLHKMPNTWNLHAAISVPYLPLTYLLIRKCNYLFHGSIK